MYVGYMGGGEGIVLEGLLGGELFGVVGVIVANYVLYGVDRDDIGNDCNVCVSNCILMFVVFFFKRRVL